MSSGVGNEKETIVCNEMNLSCDENKTETTGSELKSAPGGCDNLIGSWFRAIRSEYLNLNRQRGPQFIKSHFSQENRSARLPFNVICLVIIGQTCFLWLIKVLTTARDSISWHKKGIYHSNIWSYIHYDPCLENKAQRWFSNVFSGTRWLWTSFHLGMFIESGQILKSI